MGYTNKTSHYDLPQWIAGDKPSWLGDVNAAMLNIDTAIAASDASASAAESSAAAANAQVQAQEAKISKNTADIQALTDNLADTQGQVNTVKTIAEGALPKSGGTMTGNLILNGAPTSDLQAATKKYVDDNSGKGALMLTGGTMTGPLTLSGAPTSDLMAATKKYVDEHISNKQPLTLDVTLDANGSFCGWVEGGVLFANGAILTSGNIEVGTAFAHINGNPLGLTSNTPTKVGWGFITDTKSFTAISAKYDGTKTILTASTETNSLAISITWYKQ